MQRLAFTGDNRDENNSHQTRRRETKHQRLRLFSIAAEDRPHRLTHRRPPGPLPPRRDDPTADSSRKMQVSRPARATPHRTPRVPPLCSTVPSRGPKLPGSLRWHALPLCLREPLRSTSGTAQGLGPTDVGVSRIERKDVRRRGCAPDLRPLNTNARHRGPLLRRLPGIPAIVMFRELLTSTPHRIPRRYDAVPEAASHEGGRFGGTSDSSDWSSNRCWRPQCRGLARHIACGRGGDVSQHPSDLHTLRSKIY